MVRLRRMVTERLIHQSINLRTLAIGRGAENKEAPGTTDKYGLVQAMQPVGKCCWKLHIIGHMFFKGLRDLYEFTNRREIADPGTFCRARAPTQPMDLR